MTEPVRAWVLFPVRTPARAALSAALLALAALAGWQGLRAYQFRRDRAAAKEALARYDFPEARRRLESCLGLWPRDAEALLLAAQAARRDGQLVEATAYLDRYREQSDQSTPEGALQTVLLKVQGGQVKEFVRPLLEFLEVRHPESEQIMEALAQGCVLSYRLDEASFWTKQLLDNYPHNPVGRLIEAQTNQTMRRRERALELTDRLVEDYPENDKAREYLAGLLVYAHRYEDAARHYRELHRRQPAAPGPLLGLAQCLQTLNRYDEAEPLIRELQERHPDKSEALLECGRFAMRQKRPAEAEPLLRRAEKLSPNDYEVHLELSRCLTQLGQADEARRHLERFKQIEADMMALDKAFQAMVKAPNDPAPRLDAGVICLRNGQVSEGLRWLSGALELAPDHKPTHAALADYYQQQGDEARAATHRRKAGRSGS